MTGWKSAVGAAVAAALASGPSFAIRDLQGTDPTVIRTKCTTRWGYSAPGYVEACVAMGIADYCNANRSYTQTGTPVLIYDLDIPGHAPTPGVDHWFEWDDSSPLLSFEAGWAPDSPTTKKYGRPLCLSKKRWATLPVDGPCPTVLPDPRKDQSAKYCEDIAGLSVGALEQDNLDALRTLRARRALLFNKSAFLDRGLYLWTNGTHYYTTTAGFFSGARRRDEPPAPSYRAVTTLGEPLVGVLLSEELHWFATNPTALPASSPLRRLSSLHLVPLTTYAMPGGAFITSTKNLGGRPVRLEGYLFKTEADARGASSVLTPTFIGVPKALVQFKTADGKFALATRSPGPEWRAGDVEGWILRGGR